MRKRLINGSILLLVILVLAAFQQADQVLEADMPDPCYMENTTFQGGEKLVYKVYYNWNFVWIPAGTATFTVTDEGDLWHLVVDGRTLKSYEWFYKVRDRYETYIDKATMLPVTYIRSVQEGKYRLYSRTEFDQNTFQLTNFWGDYAEDAKPTEYSVDGCMHDLVSIVYYMRNIEKEYAYKDNKVPVEIFLDKEVWSLDVHFYGKQVKRIKGAGRYNTIKFSPELISGEVFKEGDQMSIWATDDANRIPLLIESPVSVGSVKAILQDYSGLRSPFTAAF